MEISIATIKDIKPYFNFLVKQSKECGKDGEIIYSPISENFKKDLDETKKDKEKKWNTPVTDTGWERVWIVKNDKGEVVAELQLHDPHCLKASLHRANLSMQIDKAFRKQGLGNDLLKEVISWAKKQPSLEWIQLFVFSNNTPAVNLYKKNGFKEIGTTPDMFRVHGKSIDDTEMVLKLKR